MRYLNVEAILRLKDPRNRVVALWTAVFLVVSHAFRWFSTAFNHDSLVVHQVDGSWQALLGRYLVPAYLVFRGKIANPFLIGLISSVFLIISNILIVRILDIKTMTVRSEEHTSELQWSFYAA